MTWHLDEDATQRYVNGDLGAAHAASVEAHLLACAKCRALLGARIDESRLQATWTAVADVVDQPRVRAFERLLLRVGVPEHLARLVVLSPSLRIPWLLAVSSLLLLSTATTHTTAIAADRGFFLFLVLAPLLPLAGIALAFAPRADPARELLVAAPISGIEMLLVRSVTVLVTTTVLTAIAAVAVPGNEWSVATWLLPALGLTTAALAMSRWMSASAAAIGLGAAWLLAASWVALGNTTRTHFVDSFVAFRPAGQAAFIVLTIAAGVVVITQRNAFDLRRVT
ncbi:MAG TPA: zf-HC2 domain-containing protein [Acidimicrobiales bacterium]|nr:zf-HC2 domain-containing protein [Acidimicrobiales bacterium]